MPPPAVVEVLGEATGPRRFGEFLSVLATSFCGTETTPPGGGYDWRLGQENRPPGLPQSPKPLSTPKHTTLSGQRPPL